VSPVKYELGFYIPEDVILDSHRRENLKSDISVLSIPAPSACCWCAHGGEERSYRRMRKQCPLFLRREVKF
jgi:hypothetical protein